MIYPLTVIADRYTGVYSGGEYTAWNLDFSEIPLEVSGSDLECSEFWTNNTLPVGKGKTPEKAIQDLERILGKKEDY